MGNTAVLNELTARMQASGRLVLRGGGVSAGAFTRAVARLYRAVVDLLGNAHRTRPLGELLGDAHWLDPDTLDLLALASDVLVPQGVVVAVALRADEAPEVSAEIDAVAARHRDESVRRSHDISEPVSGHRRQADPAGCSAMPQPGGYREMRLGGWAEAVRVQPAGSGRTERCLRRSSCSQ
jgi:hypothetical protein